MAPRNSMRTKTRLFKRKTFPLKCGQSGCGAEACSRNQWGYEPRIKTKWKLQSTSDIVYGLFDFSKHIYYYSIKTSF